MRCFWFFVREFVYDIQKFAIFTIRTVSVRVMNWMSLILQIFIASTFASTLSKFIFKQKMKHENFFFVFIDKLHWEAKFMKRITRSGIAGFYNFPAVNDNKQFLLFRRTVTVSTPASLSDMYFLLFNIWLKRISYYDVHN